MSRRRSRAGIVLVVVVKFVERLVKWEDPSGIVFYGLAIAVVSAVLIARQGKGLTQNILITPFWLCRVQIKGRRGIIQRRWRVAFTHSGVNSGNRSITS